MAKAFHALQPSNQVPASGTTRITTPEPDKSLRFLLTGAAQAQYAYSNLRAQRR